LAKPVLSHAAINIMEEREREREREREMGKRCGKR
jgi:hypothetical protein